MPNEARGNGSRTDEPIIGEMRVGSQTVPVPCFRGFPPSTDATGDIESMNFLAGQGVGLVSDIKPAAAILRELVESAQQIIKQRIQRIVR